MQAVQDHKCEKEKCARCILKYFDKQVKDEDPNKYIEMLEQKLNESKILLKDARVEFESRLHETAAFVKDDIDIRVESIKSEIDKVRDRYFNKVDNYVQELREYFFSMSTVEPVKDQDTSCVDKLKHEIEGNIKQIDQFYETKFNINFIENNLKFDKDYSIGDIRLSVNKMIPESEWIYYINDYSVENVELINTIEDVSIKKDFFGGDGWISNLVYLGRDYLAYNTSDDMIKIWDLSSDECLASIKFECSLLVPLSDRKLLAASPSIYVKPGDALIWDLEEPGKLLYETNCLDGRINCCILLENNMLVGGEIIENPVDNDSYLGFWSIDDLYLNLEERIKYSGKARILCIESLPTKCVATGDTNGVIRLYNWQTYALVKKIKINLWINALKYLMDNIVIFTNDSNKILGLVDYEKEVKLRMIETDRHVYSILRLPKNFFACQMRDSICIHEPNTLSQISIINAEEIHANDEIKAIVPLDDNVSFASCSANEIVIFGFE